MGSSSTVQTGLIMTNTAPQPPQKKENQRRFFLAGVSEKKVSENASFSSLTYFFVKLLYVFTQFDYKSVNVL